MKPIITEKELAHELNLDDDYCNSEDNIASLHRLLLSASSFIQNATGHDFSEDAEIEPLAVDVCIMFCKQRWYADSSFSADYDYHIGISADLYTLSLMAKGRKQQ